MEFVPTEVATGVAVTASRDPTEVDCIKFVGTWLAMSVIGALERRDAVPYKGCSHGKP